MKSGSCFKRASNWDRHPEHICIIRYARKPISLKDDHRRSSVLRYYLAGGARVTRLAVAGVVVDAVHASAAVEAWVNLAFVDVVLAVTSLK